MTLIATGEPCRWCGATHGKICPYVKAFEFGATGEITRVEFLTPADYPPLKVDPADQQEYDRLGHDSKD